MERRMVSRWSGRNPGSAFAMASRLRIMSPAPISSIRESAISATTSAPRKRPRCLRIPCRSGRDARQAGKTPKNRPVTTEMARVKASTRPSTAISAKPARAKAGTSPRTAFHQPEGQQRSGEAAGQRQDDALRKQLPHEARPPRPERRPQGQLAPPRGRFRQQQAGHIGAGNEQHETHGAEQHQHALALPARLYGQHGLPQRLDDGAPAPVRFRGRPGRCWRRCRPSPRRPGPVRRRA